MVESKQPRISHGFKKNPKDCKGGSIITILVVILRWISHCAVPVGYGHGFVCLILCVGLATEEKDIQIQRILYYKHC